MTITKKLLVTGLVAASFVGSAAYAISSKYTASFNWSLLKPLVERSKRAVEEVDVAFKYSKQLYAQQKNALKIIANELKQAYEIAKLSGKGTWFADKQLYKMYKKFVYKSWKKNGTFTSF